MIRTGTTARGRSLLVVGIALIGLSLVVAAVLVMIGAQRAHRTVNGLARAPAGCDTAIRFDRAGTFNVYVETTGRLEDLAGSCPAPVEFAGDGDAPVQVQVTLTDPADGSTLRLGRTTALAYERDGFAGVRFRTVKVDAPITIVARVLAPAGEDVVVAIGPDPERAAGRLALIGIITALVGGVIGFALVVAGLIRRFAASPAVEVSRPDGPTASTAIWDRPIGPAGSPLPPPPPPGIAPPTSASGSDSER